MKEFVVPVSDEGNIAFIRNGLKLPELVRCKDCKHYDSETQSCLDGLDGIFQPDWYCADGERKDGDGDGKP